MTNTRTTDLATLSTDELVAAYNETFGKAIKKGSYTRTKMIEALEAARTEDEEDLIGEAPKTDEGTPGACPFCNGDPGNQTAAGEDGTFLGDYCAYCHECGKTYNRITGEEVEETPKSKKRKILNPQPKINAKTDAAVEAGAELTYERETRTWFLMKGNKTLGQWTSRQFAEITPAGITSRATKG